MLGIIILAHANAVELGQWQGDDYDYAAGLRDHGFAFAWHRLATDTPRPFSEFLLFLYAAAIDRLHRPLIGTFLSLCWAILLLGCGFRLVACTRRGGGRAMPRVFLACGLVSLFLLGHPVADMLYWPVGAAAYVPTVAALCCLTIQILDDGLDTAAGRGIAAACLVLAAGSSEMGAFVVLGFTTAMLLARLTPPVRRSEPVAWLLAPLLLVTMRLRRHRPERSGGRRTDPGLGDRASWARKPARGTAADVPGYGYRRRQ